MTELHTIEDKYKKLKKVKTVLLIVLIAMGIACTLSITVPILFVVLFILVSIVGISFVIVVVKTNKVSRELTDKLQSCVLKSLNLPYWMQYAQFDTVVNVPSKKAVYSYDEIKFFKEHEGALSTALKTVQSKKAYAELLMNFLKTNEFRNILTYDKIEMQVKNCLLNAGAAYNICVKYISPSGQVQESGKICLSEKRLNELTNDKSLLMSKSEYNKYCKEQAKEQLESRQHFYYNKVNDIIDFANDNRSILVSEKDVNELDKCVTELIARTINNIKKIKTIDSEEWDILNKVIDQSNSDITDIINKRKKVLDYYNSQEFSTIKQTCDNLTSKQKEFNEYIEEKAQSISKLFGTNIIRNETQHEDEYDYIHPYKKSITPFTAEVSATVFASAENNPLPYIVKYFYPEKERYPEQIQKLHLLIEELETLKEAKNLIDNYKKDIQQYIENVPDYVMNSDSDGFYSRLGFAVINEKILTVEYKFSYTSDGGKAQRTFTVPMTEDVIIQLIRALESKLTMSSFTKEQRLLMTSKLRQFIKERDNYTCKYCGNSTNKEPNLLLEIDHIIPVSKGGYTEESNLQTLCWKCNRHKSDKVV